MAAGVAHPDGKRWFLATREGIRVTSLEPPQLRAADLVLPAEAAERLDAATRIDLGFPAAFIRDNTAWVLGELLGYDEARITELVASGVLE